MLTVQISFNSGSRCKDLYFIAYSITVLFVIRHVVADSRGSSPNENNERNSKEATNCCSSFQCANRQEYQAKLNSTVLLSTVFNFSQNYRISADLNE